MAAAWCVTGERQREREKVEEREVRRDPTAAARPHARKEKHAPRAPPLSIPFSIPGPASAWSGLDGAIPAPDGGLGPARQRRSAAAGGPGQGRPPAAAGWLSLFFFSRVFLPRGRSYSACFGCGRVGEGGNWPSWRGQGGGAKGVRGSTNTPPKQNGLKRDSAFVILSFFLFSPPSLAAKNTMPYTGTAPLSPPTRISSTDPDPVAVMAAREAAARAAHVRIEKAKVRRGAEGVRGRGRPRRLASGQPNARAGAIGPVEHTEVNGANTSRQRAPPVFFFLCLSPGADFLWRPPPLFFFLTR